MSALSAGPIEALEAALRSLSRLGDLYGAGTGAVKRISGATLALGPGGTRVIQRSGGLRRPRRFVRCTCPRPARRKTDQPHQTDH